MSVKMNNFMKEKSKASKFVSILIKFCFLPVSIEEDVIKFKISKAIFHIIIYPGFCVANLLFVRFYFKKWIFSNLIVAKGFVESLAILMYYSTSGKTFILNFYLLIYKKDISNTSILQTHIPSRKVQSWKIMQDI